MDRITKIADHYGIEHQPEKSGCFSVIRISYIKLFCYKKIL